MIAGGFPRSLFRLSRRLRGSHRALALAAALRKALLDGFPRLEKVGPEFRPKPGTKHGLGDGADVYRSPLAVMLCLVSARGVDPDPARRVEVRGTHNARLPGSHAGQALQLDHGP